MPIKVCTCLCGSTDQLARQTLKQFGYPDWLSIQIPQGKEKSLRMLELMPQFPEVEMLRNFLKDASKWVVIIGWDDESCRWSDIAHNSNKSRIEAEFVVQKYQSC